jgi:hypothetical protein
MSPDSFAERVAALSRKWNEVEALLKRGEQVDDDVIIPSVNELRYAGRRLVDAYEAYVKGDFDKAKKDIDAADDNLNKAKHDLVDTIFYFVSENADELRCRIGEDAANSHFAKYGELFGLIKKIESQIQRSRESREDRESIYGELLKSGGDLWRLCDMREEFSASVPAIEDAIRKRKLEMQQELQESKKQARINQLFTVMSLLIALMTLVSKFL